MSELYILIRVPKGVSASGSEFRPGGLAEPCSSFSEHAALRAASLAAQLQGGHGGHRTCLQHGATGAKVIFFFSLTLLPSFPATLPQQRLQWRHRFIQGL